MFETELGIKVSWKDKRWNCAYCHMCVGLSEITRTCKSMPEIGVKIIREQSMQYTEQKLTLWRNLEKLILFFL